VLRGVLFMESEVVRVRGGYFVYIGLWRVLTKRKKGKIK
jgi:hypothetical protein